MAVFEGDQPLRVAVFFSGGASGFSYLADHDPDFGETYDVVVGIASDPEAPGMDAIRAAGIPVEANDIEAFYEEREASLTDLDVRADYDAETAAILKSYDPDLVLLSGYMWILTEAITDAYHVINVHPADLAIEDESGDRQYIGGDPVYDAIVAGEAKTRSTVHFVTPAVDAGSILVRSKPLAVHRELVDDLVAFDAEGGIREYANAHQEWMKWEGDGPAIAKAIDLIATGRVDYDDGTVRIDGSPGYVDLEP